MKRFVALLTLMALLLGVPSCKGGGKIKYTDYSFDYFDTVTTLVGYGESKAEFDQICTRVKELLKEYHQLYDIYHRYEGITNLCSVNDLQDGVHQPRQVDEKIIGLLLYAKELYTLTNGQMNVAMGSVLSLWHQYRSEGTEHPETAALPPMDKLKDAAAHTDIEKMVIDQGAGTVFLSDPKMTLDVGALAKGYATEQIARELERSGVTGFLLNVGGNVRCIGGHPDGSGWSIGIENPDTDNTQKPYIAYLELKDQSLVTSGSYQRFYTVDGVRYHHIIDPDTLMPGNRYRSVSVLCKDSGKADALSTALFNLPYIEGCALIGQIPDAEAMWVMPDGEQRYSDGFPKQD